MCSSHIFFDGSLPPQKREERVRRLESYLKQRHQLRFQHPKGCLIPDSNALPKSIERTLSFLQGHGAPPFLVPSVFDAIEETRYTSVTQVVHGEADSYCAAAVKDGGGLVLTGDSDLLVHDLGQAGAIVFLNDIDIEVADGKRAPVVGIPHTLRILVHQPAKIARRLQLASLVRLAYEIQSDPQVSFSQALQRSKQEVNDPTSYQVFSDEYTHLPLHSTSTGAQPPYLDPRLSEVIKQLQIPADGHSIHAYLPFLFDDPTRSSAWDVSLATRYLTYVILRSHMAKHVEDVTEYSRKGFRIHPASMPLQPCYIQDFLPILVQRLQELKEQFPSMPPTQRYRVYALKDTYQWYCDNDKSPPSRRQLAQAFTGGLSTLGTGWEHIHLDAQVQAVLYALRMLKQALCFLADYDGPQLDDTEDLNQIKGQLDDLPRLSDLIPCSRDLGTLVHTSAIDRTKIFDFITTVDESDGPLKSSLLHDW